jgi:hypothetical protein
MCGCPLTGVMHIPYQVRCESQYSLCLSILRVLSWNIVRWAHCSIIKPCESQKTWKYFPLSNAPRCHKECSHSSPACRYAKSGSNVMKVTEWGRPKYSEGSVLIDILSAKNPASLARDRKRFSAVRGQRLLDWSLVLPYTFWNWAEQYVSIYGTPHSAV